MRLSQLSINSVRNLTEANLACGPGCNIIFGENAAGKTAILEAIHILARTSSFRTHRITEVIQHNQETLSISAEVCINNGDTRIHTGLEKGRSQTRIRYNGERITRRSEQARNLPLLTVTADSHRLLFGSPKDRRHWLDWSLFHVEPGYIQAWQDYHQALRQRNILLRKAAPPEELIPWEKAMATAAEPLVASRREYLQQLQQALVPFLAADLNQLAIDYTGPELSAERYQDKLQRHRKTDSLLGHTQYGPHRDDVVFYLDESKNAAGILSRGQAKKLIIALTLAQAVKYQEHREQTPILLLDDLPAELDDQARAVIHGQIQGQAMQVFITTTNPETLAHEPGQTATAMFHVERGQVTKVVE
jgi:DNA replication and repair protein RecF